MTESTIDQENNELEVLSFGEYLSVERKKQNLSIADVAKGILLSEKVIDAIEMSDIEQLPQPTFVQGYIRAYAKYLGISDSTALEAYAQAAPHKQEADLHPRSKLPSEASSNSPIVKMITILLLVLMVAAALYASFDYYKNAILTNDAEPDNRASLSLPEMESYEQDSEEHDVLSRLQDPIKIDQNIEAQETIVNAEEQNNGVDVEAAGLEGSTNIAEQRVEDALAMVGEGDQKSKNLLTSEGDDELELIAAKVSWVEVDDANSKNLYYDLLQKGQRLTLKGTAPFKVFLGDAPQVKVKINNVSANIEKHIRSNNIANFSISVDQQQVVFH